VSPGHGTGCNTLRIKSSNSPPASLQIHGWPCFGLTMALNVAAQCTSVTRIPAGQRPNEQAADMTVDHFGSDASCRYVPNGWSSKVRTLSVTAGR
jgi:hypothetical protein